VKLSAVYDFYVVVIVVHVSTSPYGQRSHESEDENDIYLVDSNQILLGRVDMKRLLKADDSLTGMDVLQTDVFKFDSADSVELAFNQLKDFVGISVPITQDNKLVGITNEGMLIEFYLESLDDVRNQELGIVKD